jgi:hypothetical protein
VVFDYAGFYEIALDPLDATVCSFFVNLHQAAVARDVACDNRSKTTWRHLARRLATFTRLEVANFGHGSDWFP